MAILPGPTSRHVVCVKFEVKKKQDVQVNPIRCFRSICLTHTFIIYQYVTRDLNENSLSVCILL